MLKLYYCSATGTDHDWNEIIAAESEFEAKMKWSKMVENSGTWYAREYVDELKLDGFKIMVEKTK